MAILGDIRAAFRVLLRSPAYALTCISVLALGIGMNAAIFSVVYSVILAPLPYPDASRLVFVWQKLLGSSDPLFDRVPASREAYLEWQKQTAIFEGMAAFNANTSEETSGDHPRRLATAFASANLFPMLGVRAATGRLFRADQEQPGHDHVALISDAYFSRRFHRDPAALGKPITLGGTAYTIAGVLPSRFHLPATWQGQDQLKPRHLGSTLAAMEHAA